MDYYALVGMIITAALMLSLVKLLSWLTIFHWIMLGGIVICTPLMAVAGLLITDSLFPNNPDAVVWGMLAGPVVLAGVCAREWFIHRARLASMASRKAPVRRT